MAITIKTNPDQQSWDNFILSHPSANLLQSWAWGEFQQSLGNKIWRLQTTEQDKVIAELLIIKLSLGFGKSIFYAPRDLLFNKFASAQDQHTASKLLLEHVRDLAKKESVILFRIDPAISPTDSTALAIYKSLGFTSARKDIQPRRNAVLNINQSEADILAGMKSKTRYNIKVAEKHNINIVESFNIKDVDIFKSLTHQTSSRNQFKSYSDNYYQKQLEVLGGARMMSLLIAYSDNIPLSAILVSFFGKTASYLHGGSSRQMNEKMASYAIQWQAIKLAKSRGCTTYDFGGIVDDQHPQWEGISRFKEGFGTQPVEYVGTMELPLNQVWCKLYYLLSLLRGA